MLEKLIFEKVSNKNFEDFLFLVDKLAEYEKLTPPDKNGKNRLKKDALSKNPKYEAYIWKLNEKPVGYIIFFMTYSSFLALPTFYLEDIFLLKEHRGKGIGKQMFQFCINTAKNKKCGRMEWCVLNWNKLAIEFYEKVNAKPLSEWTYYRLDKKDIKKLGKK